MKKNKKIIITAVFILLIIFSLNYLGYGNSAEPPSILIIVPNAPDDLSITLDLEEKYEEKVVNKIIEKYYTFYLSAMFNKPNIYNFTVSTENDSFEIELSKPIRRYENIYTLDLKAQTLTEGKLLSRSIMLVSMRLALTLLIEAFIFWIFGFRNRESWLVFFIINLITQGALNIWLNGLGPIMSYAIFFTLVFGEIFVFVFELIVFSLFCKEHGSIRKATYVLSANCASLIVGGYIITVLPV